MVRAVHGQSELIHNLCPLAAREDRSKTRDPAFWRATPTAFDPNLTATLNYQIAGSMLIKRAWCAGINEPAASHKYSKVGMWRSVGAFIHFASVAVL
jgi:hypothetical protein